MSVLLRWIPVLAVFLSPGLCAAQETEPVTEVIDIGSEQDFYDLLMMLDQLAVEPIYDPLAFNPDGLAAEQAPVEEESQIDERWMLSFLALLDDQIEGEENQLEAELRDTVTTLERAAAVATGDVKATLSAAATDLQQVIVPASRLSGADSKAVRYLFAEAQRAMGLFHCQQANRDAGGTLAEPIPSMRQRLSDLSTAGNYMIAASRTANYRIPSRAKNSLAVSVALSRLFSEDEVRLSQVRTRARELERALDDLGGAIRRAQR